MSERSAIRAFLRSDLYEPHARADDVEWVSPLGWRVRVSGTLDAPVVEIIRPDGETFCKPTPMQVETLSEILP